VYAAYSNILISDYAYRCNRSGKTMLQMEED
jgi:hypothetical protein